MEKEVEVKAASECANKRPAPGWKVRLVDERSELLERTLNLKNFIDNPDNKLGSREWEMLHRQFSFMRMYLKVLTERCVYYGLIESGDLGLHY